MTAEKIVAVPTDRRVTRAPRSMSVWVAAWRSHRDAASEGAAKQQAAAERDDTGNERRQHSRYERRAEISRAELGRRNEEPRTQCGRADETNEQPKSGAQNSIRQCTLPA